jgi:hypothetical protein
MGAGRGGWQQLRTITTTVAVGGVELAPSERADQGSLANEALTARKTPGAPIALSPGWRRPLQVLDARHVRGSQALHNFSVGSEKLDPVTGEAVLGGDN